MRNSSSSSHHPAVVGSLPTVRYHHRPPTVETLQQRDACNLGRTQMQGHLFSAARPAHETAAAGIASGGRRGRR